MEPSLGSTPFNNYKLWNYELTWAYAKYAGQTKADKDADKDNNKMKSGARREKSQLEDFTVAGEC